jgi:hypothetical protein
MPKKGEILRTTFENFEIQSQIKSGGAGEVYLAKNASRSLLKYVKHVAKWKIESRQNARRTVCRTLARVYASRFRLRFALRNCFSTNS